ncbi:MAG: 4Fe-4S dicluster domain-containing protein [Acidobacteria bacterium]|nr:MAG: 4Fe-4S dicluster domain-containing protein [Acidobacteriota bacterium]
MGRTDGAREETMAQVSINPDLCDDTRACLAVCPEDVFELDGRRVKVGDASRCTLCFKCVENCPEGAVEIDF